MDKPFYLSKDKLNLILDLSFLLNFIILNMVKRGHINPKIIKYVLVFVNIYPNEIKIIICKIPIKNHKMALLLIKLINIVPNPGQTILNKIST